VRRALALALVVTVAAGCAVPLDAPPTGPAEEQGATARPGGTFRVAFPEDPHHLDPALGYDTTSWWAEQLLFDTLVTYDEGTSIVPDLAERWEVSPDGRRFTFHLRPDVVFSTGRMVTAADVKYSLQRLLTPALHSPGVEFFTGIEGADDYVAGKADAIRGIEVSAPDRLVFALTQPDPLFLHKLTMPFAAVVDRETIERDGDRDFDLRHPVGTGAFVLAEWTYGETIRFERNPRYFRRDLPYLDAIHVAIGANDQLAWLQYLRGELDVAGIPSAEFARVVADARYKPLLVSRTTLRTSYLGLNCQVAPFDRVAVRQAVNMAIDRQRILDLADDRGVVAHGILPPDMPGYDPGLRGFPYDPARARTVLADAGVAPGLTTTFWVARDDLAFRMAQSIQQDLRAIGMTLLLKPVDFPALIEGVRVAGEVPMFMFGWEADFPDPSNFLDVLFNSRNQRTNNNTFYANPETDRLLDEAERLLDPAARLRLFHEAEVRIVDDAPWVPLMHPSGVNVRNPRVRDYVLHPLRPTRLERVWLAS
jgi:peptide/nickel transport system substrate-binding protein/oligopeptide transport system substrate-binding protein